MITHPVLASLEGSGMRLGLDDMRGYLAFLGNPHLAYPVVHVAGTNGKGSVCTLVTEALVAAGYRVGTNTSPHLEAVNERIRLDGVPIDDASLAEAIEATDRDRWVWARSAGIAHTPLTHFEFLTALAFRVFAERAVDVAVIEVGLGGRLDGTNVVSPCVCAITGIGLDHMAELGDDVATIAAEKAGILKQGVPVVLGVMPDAARVVIEARAAALGAELWSAAQLRRERRVDGAGAVRWSLGTPDGTVGPLVLAMEGAHQGANAAVAVGVLHRLRRAGFVVDDAAITAGLERARVSGRIETLRPGLIVDGAHNPDGTAALAAWLTSRARPARRILLFGMGRDRDARAVLAPLLPLFDEVVLTRCDHPNARDPADIAEALGPVDVPLSDGGPVEGCLDEVCAEADEVIVAGSLYLVGAVRALVAQR